MSAPSVPSPAATDVDLDALLRAVREGAAERERDRIPPHDAVRLIGASGLGALRVPVADGGPGASLRELFDVVIRLSEADPNVAQSVRAHFHFVEGRRTVADAGERARWFGEVLAGRLFGNATIERTTRDLFGFETTLTPRPGGDGYLLRGTKYYSTGSLYADHVVVAAVLPGGETVAAVVPADRAGVVLEDDWDGMGQRLTASGTSRFDDVHVAPDEVLPSAINSGNAAPRGTFLQLFLVAVAAGVAGETAADAAALLGRRSRTFSHGAAERPADDPLLQLAVGEIDAAAFAARAVVLAAADALDAAEASGQDPDAVHAAALQAARAQVVVSELVPRAATRLFDAGGASATARDVNLDRHWRNARTLASHNPAAYKAKAIGDLRVNGTRLPANGFF